jgi:hypothetical protein
MTSWWRLPGSVVGLVVGGCACVGWIVAQSWWREEAAEAEALRHERLWREEHEYGLRMNMWAKTAEMEARRLRALLEDIAGVDVGEAEEAWSRVGYD